jgi:hypothetical protein
MPSSAYRSNDVIEDDDEGDESGSALVPPVEARPPAAAPLSDRVLTHLSASPVFIPTTTLARALGVKKTELNPVLYRLLKENKVRKEAEPDGTAPRWASVAV